MARVYSIRRFAGNVQSASSYVDQCENRLKGLKRLAFKVCRPDSRGGTFHMRAWKIKPTQAS